MARVTVDNSLKNVKNRFELVLLAAKRARDLSMGGVQPTVPWNDDKSTVVALREIADGEIKPEYLYKKVPELKPVKPSYQFIDDHDFSGDNDPNAALIAALTAATDEDKSQFTVDADENQA